MTHYIARNVITAESMEDKHPWKKNYVIKYMSQTCEVALSMYAVKVNLGDAL